jgi:hypothetical protein
MPPMQSDLTGSVQAGSGQASSGLFPESSELRRALLDSGQTLPHHSTLARSVREILFRTVPVQSSILKGGVAGRTEGAKD